jgi:UDP-N-acetylmuramyl pentapeptide synthase
VRFANVDDALAFAQGRPLTGQMILVKGSRGIKLESLLPVL